jgi:hypothetical protein
MRLALVTGTAVLAWAGVAAADPLAPLDFSAPPACVDASTFRARLLALPASPVKTEPPRAMTIRVAESDDTFTGELQVEHADGTTTVRQVASAHCDEVTDALEFVAALALGLDARPPTPTPTPTPRPEPTWAPRHWRVFAAAYAEIAGAAGPNVEFAPQLALGTMLDAPGLFAPELELSGTWATSGTFATTLSPPASATLTLLDAALAGCPLRFDVGLGLGFRPCAALQLGALRASSSLAGSTDQVQPWLAAAVLARAEWRVGRYFMVGVDGGAVFPILHDDYFFTNVAANPSRTTVYDVPRIGGIARLGAAVLWP